MSLLILQRKTHTEYSTDSKDRHTRFSDNIDFSFIANQNIIKRNNKFRNDDSGVIISYFPCLMLLIGIVFILCIVFLYRSYKKKKKQMIALSIISIIISSSITIWAVNEYNTRKIIEEQNTYYEIEYTLKIYVNTMDNYSLLVPYLMDYALQTETKIRSGKGHLDYVMVNGTPLTVSPITLKVSGVGNISVHGHIRLFDNSYAYMSMADNSASTTPEYWVYCEKTNENQNISLYIRGDSGDRHW